MSAATASFTIADLERMPEDGMHRELLHGELIELPPPKSGHTKTAMRLARSLGRYLDGRDGWGEVWAEAGFQLDQGSCLQPDVAVVTAAQAAVADDQWAHGAPLVAFEIVSPSESAVDIEAKSEAYLNAGARAVVWIYPRTRTARIAGELERHLREPDTLELPDILPGWSLPLADLFLR